MLLKNARKKGLSGGINQALRLMCWESRIERPSGPVAAPCRGSRLVYRSYSYCRTDYSVLGIKIRRFAHTKYRPELWSFERCWRCLATLRTVRWSFDHMRIVM